MTEYDFSPEAIERYMHTQRRIAHWVDETEEHRSQFGSAVTTSAHEGTPPTLQRSLPERRAHPAHGRRPSFSSSSESSSSSTESSDYSGRLPTRMEAFQPMYLQHPVVDPLQSNHHLRSDSHHHQLDRRSSHDRSPPRSSYVMAPTPAPQIYRHSSGHGSSGMPPVSSRLKEMPPLTSPPRTSYYQPTPIHPTKHTYPHHQNIYPRTVPAGGPIPQLPARPPIQAIYSDPIITRQSSNTQYLPGQGAYPGPPTIYPLTAYGPQQSLQRPVIYQRVFRDVVTRQKGTSSSRRSRSGGRSR